jgi:hypothetical protein
MGGGERVRNIASYRVNFISASGFYRFYWRAAALLTFPDGVALVLPSLPLFFSDTVVAARSSHFSCWTWLGVSSLAIGGVWFHFT